MTKYYGWLFQDGTFISTQHTHWLDDNGMDYKEAYENKMMRLVDGCDILYVKNNFYEPNAKQIEKLLEFAIDGRFDEVRFQGLYDLNSKTLWSKYNQL